ncbi:MAG: lipid asymmetry maintenance ABC transporter permease subunit MlaE [Legionellales bacterium]|jgi:phospholipid/cholesterol/gamma-HCH transport system permease protein|nr:lipid asymmetry maintenance ABC transporter permease subunit MlaE [Legionellales bacterium]
MLKCIQNLGHSALMLAENTGVSFKFLCKIIFKFPRKLNHWYAVIEQIYFLGVLSLVIILISGAFIGMVVALQGYHTLSEFGAQSELSKLIALSVFRELGPVVTALLFAGRAGSALTAEVGLMKVGDQLTSMEVMAVDPISYVAFPRFVAGIITMPLLAILFCATAIYAGYLVSVFWLGIDSGTFLSVMKSGVDFNVDVMQGIKKSFIFGVVASFIAIYQGFHTDNTASGLGRAATKTVVFSSIAILGLDFILTAFMLGG